MIPHLSVTLNDLERRNGRYFALFQRIPVASGAHCVKFTFAISSPDEFLLSRIRAGQVVCLKATLLRDADQISLTLPLINCQMLSIQCVTIQNISLTSLKTNRVHEEVSSKQ